MATQLQTSRPLDLPARARARARTQSIRSSTYGGTANSVNGIAAWNSSASTWTVVGAASTPGLAGRVTAIFVNGSTVFAGGEFGSAYGGRAGSLNNVAQCDGLNGAWSAVGAGPTPGVLLAGATPGVKAFAGIGATLYMGGGFLRQTTSRRSSMELRSGRVRRRCYP